VNWLWATLDMYRRAAQRAGGLVLRNWPVLASVYAYAAILWFGAEFALRMGLVGGIAYSLVVSACAGSFLYLVEMMVRTSRVTFEDFGRSFTAYLWDVVGVTFILWIFFRIAGPVLMTTPQGGIILLCVQIAILVFFNAVPELIYLGHHSSLALLGESYRFIADNWIEWFPPNLVAALMLGGWWGLRMPGLAAYAAQLAVATLFVYFVMVMRGFLFLELNGTSRRGRAFRYRMGG
jgi:hypothetical protein